MTIRKISTAAAGALALSAFATGALAAGTVSTTASGSVSILSPFSLTTTQAMLFGTVIRPATGTNTVSLDVNGAVAVTGAGDGATAASSTSAAKLSLVANPGTTYTTTQSLSFTQTGLININATLPAATTGSVGTVPLSGTQELRYGGSFDMSAATTAQAYTGTLSVTVNYN